MSLKQTNEAALLSGKEHIFLKNARGCGQLRLKELWLCVNGGIKMGGMKI